MDSVAVKFPFAVVGKRIQLTHPQHGLLVSADQLEVAPSLLSLVRGHFRLKRIIIDHAVVRLRVEEGQIVNLPRLTAQPQPNKPENRRLPLRVLLVREATVEVDAQPLYHAALQHVNVTLGVTRGTLLDLNVSAQGGYLEHEGVRENITKLSMSGRVAPDKVQVDLAAAGHLGLLAGHLARLLLAAHRGRPLRRADQAQHGPRQAQEPAARPRPARAGWQGRAGHQAVGQGRPTST